MGLFTVENELELNCSFRFSKYTEINNLRISGSGQSHLPQVNCAFFSCSGTDDLLLPTATVGSVVNCKCSEALLALARSVSSF